MILNGKGGRRGKRGKQFSVLLGLILFLVPGMQAHSPEGTTLDLNEKELRWLQDHPVIRVSFDPDRQPFSYRDRSGNFVGVDIDLLRLLENELGIQFEIVAYPTWSQVYQSIRNSQVDLVTGIAHLPEREAPLHFTEPYISFPVAIITRTDAPFLTEIASLQNKKIAAPRNHATTVQLEKDHPEFHLIYTETMEQSLRMVSQHKADAGISSLPVAGAIIRKHGQANLKIAGLTPYNFDLRMATRRDWPELAHILQKTLSTVPEPEKQKIFERWISVEYRNVYRREFLIRLALVLGTMAALGGGLGFLWVQSLHREVRRREKTEQALRAAQEETECFFSMAAHDLSSPLMIIQMNLELLDESGPLDETTRRGSVTRISQMTQRMQRLVRDLLDINTIESGKRALKLQNLTLESVAAELADAFQQRAAQKDIRLELEMDGGPFRARLDRDAIVQIIDNLISNALKFSPSASTVTVRVERREGCVRLLVRDQGPGLTSEDQAHLFQKFKKLSAKPTGGETSNGLGLSIARQLAEAMGGKVGCQSTAGKGAVFSAEFPAVD
jgi:two-component system sensor histidine kinase EvgS